MHVRFVIDDIPWTWTFPGTTTALARAVRRGALPLDRFPSWTGPAPRYEGSLEPGDPETDDEVTVRTGTVWSAIAFLGDDTVRWSASRDDLGQAAPDERSRQRGAHEVGALVDRVGLDGREHEVAGELLGDVLDDRGPVIRIDNRLADSESHMSGTPS